MPLHDIDAILDRIDLETLADELCGPRRGHGSGARWPSPVPAHPQTGRTPPMSIFTDRRGRQRWTCWSTGTSGTAIDLVSVSRRTTVADSIQWLADRVGSTPDPPMPRRRQQPPKRTDASDDLKQYVQDCVQELHKPSGAATRTRLSDRCLNSEILELNQVGYDPGPRLLRRARGLPIRGEGIVIPTFDANGKLVYAQTRYLDVRRTGRKYDNPSSNHATKPSVSWPRQIGAVGRQTVVCEGVIDALTVAGVHIRSVALLSAADARGVAEQLAQIDGELVIAMDPDDAGRGAQSKLEESLSEHGITETRSLNLPCDLNDLAVRSGVQFAALVRSLMWTPNCRSHGSEHRR